MSDFITLPERLIESGTDLEREAADRIVDLEVQLFRLRVELVQLREETDQ
jgi:hypothetical protein